MLDKVEEHLLQEINRLDGDIEQQDNRNDNISVSLQQTNNAVRNNREDIDILHSTIRNVVSVGADIVPYVRDSNRSWAVICIEGKYNTVKFVDLYGQDYKDITQYLKRFEGSRMVTDAPPFNFFEGEFKLK